MACTIVYWCVVACGDCVCRHFHLRRLEFDTLFIHSKADLSIPYEESVKMYNKHPEVFALWLTDKAKHVKSFAMYEEEYIKHMLAFLEKVQK